jgi:signal transduction histidine kinase
MATFFMRRTIFVMIMHTSYFTITYGLQLFLQLGVLTYYIQAKPLKNKKENALYLFNELVFLLVLHTLPLYTEFARNEDEKF